MTTTLTAPSRNGVDLVETGVLSKMCETSRGLTVRTIIG